MTELYSSYIGLDTELIELLKTFNVTNDIGKYRSANGSIRLSFIHFNILMSLSRDHNHVLSKIDEDFLNELSIFRDKLFVVFNCDEKSFTPVVIEYWCDSNKINLVIKKRVLKLFNSIGIPLKLSKFKKPQPITTFIFP